MFLLHWPTAFVHVPFDPKIRGFPMDYEPDQCSKVRAIAYLREPDIGGRLTTLFAVFR
jgi:hypothetical protein